MIDPRELMLTDEEREIYQRLRGHVAGARKARGSIDEKDLRRLRNLDAALELHLGHRARGGESATVANLKNVGKRWGNQWRSGLRAQLSPEKQSEIDRMVVDRLPRERRLASTRPSDVGGHSSLLADVSLYHCGIGAEDLSRLYDRPRADVVLLT